MKEDKLNKNDSRNIWFPFLLSVAVAMGMVVGVKMSDSGSNWIVRTDGSSGIGRVEELIRFIETKYVDSIDSEILVEESIKSVMAQLDPHSVYIPKSQLEDVNNRMNGNFTGLGIESIMFEDTLRIIKVVEDSPADEAKLKNGDRLISVNDSIVAGRNLEYEDVKPYLQKEKGTKLKLEILENGSSESVMKELVIGAVPLKVADIAIMIDSLTGYIKLDQFNTNAYREFMKALEGLIEDHQMQNLIVDLRQNPGGFLPQAIDMLSQLFGSRDNLLVYTESQGGKITEYKSTGKNFFALNKISVLIDENSASGSEIVAGAIQDWDRGIIVGRRSFGKGLVQEQYELSNGAALRLTTARYFTPSGRLIQKSYDDLEAYDEDYMQRFSNGELQDGNKIRPADTTRYYTLNEKRTVYGGGGITPDIFVPLDSVLLDKNYAVAASYINSFLYTKMYRALNPINNETELTDDFMSNLLEEFKTFLNEKEVSFSEDEWGHIDGHLSDDLRFNLKKQFVDLAEANRVYLEKDSCVIRSLEEFYKSEE